MASEPIHSVDVWVGAAVRRVWEIEKQKRWEHFVSVLAAIAFHFIVFAILLALPKERTVDSGGYVSPVQVRVTGKDEPLAQKKTNAHPLEQRGARGRRSSEVPQSSTAPRIPVVSEETQVEPSPVAESAPLEDSRRQPLSPLSRFLPSDQSDFAENQRRVGAGTARAEGSSETLLPDAVLPALRPNVVTTEFSTLAYRLELERRFSDAWGGVRVLPSYSRFSGRTGELIVYNVVINRDGTLRRIVNLSAIEQSDRDFSAVDSLVQDFADSVFPMNSIPARVREEPFVLRWSIRFMGFQYSFF